MLKNQTILFVEDNPDDVDLTMIAFRKNNIANEVHVARDGAEAIDYLFSKGPDGAFRPLPAVVLLDLNLPKIDGHEVLSRIRADERTSRLPVVILTSSKMEEDIARSYDLGANSYIRKPVDFGQFQETVREIGLYWLVLNEPPTGR